MTGPIAEGEPNGFASTVGSPISVVIPVAEQPVVLCPELVDMITEAVAMPDTAPVSSALAAQLIPVLLGIAILGALLLVLIGPDQLEQLAGVIEELQRTAQAGTPPDPELVRSLPVGRLFLWVMLLLGAVVASGLFVFVAVPQIVFGGRGGMSAMGDSFRACLHNLPAVLLFLVLLAIALFVIGTLVQLLAVVVQLVAGATAAIWASNLLLMAVLMPLMAGGVYHAWRQLLGVEGAAPAPKAHLEA